MCIVNFYLFLFLDFSNVFSPHRYCDYFYGGGGDKNVLSTSGAHHDENPEIDLTLSL